ncbi:MAG: transcription antitermination factor NusB [Phycisphaerales bacterium]|jgi:N utilization substance protein B|nr:transcription antitermination factor NusB [Phycisphaerales bacterium]
MKIDRDARRCALQAMYQFDAGGAGDHETVRGSLEGSSAAPENQERGFALATLAWEFREESDEMILRFSPDWPIHRQPMVDRNLLRLACYEINHGETPAKAAINEAVELAKEFGGEKSPGFVNALLDRVMREAAP